MKHGFSLVELSIVLVILGLLTGGILAGQSLIRASELRAVSTEIQRYQAATNTFRDKYFALPGDMVNAQSFWGVAHATPATCKTTASTTPLTCNGDGNGVINSNPAGSNEYFRFWQHLANAGLIEGTYTGVQGPNGNLHSVISTNVPRSKINNAGHSISSAGVMSGDTDFFDGNYTNSFVFGREYTANGATIYPALKNEEAWNIDTKMDDGKPGYGKIMTYKLANQPNCATSNASNTAEYNLTNTSIACMLMILTGF